LTIRHLGAGLPSWRELARGLAPRLESVEVSGAPQPLAGQMERFLRESGSGLAARGSALAERFPAVKRAALSRDWAGRRLRVEVTMRRALARVVRPDRPGAEAWLDEDGAVFAAPAGLYPRAALAVETGGAGEAELRALARELPLLARAEALPVALERVRYRSAYEGWELSLQDGTNVLWGRLDWTPEKLRRLGEALADARGRQPEVASRWSADLRYFEDGRVLLRPGKNSRGG
ncbi:MAG: cell division protein FtsQ/DivIB, partial [Elusimicrobia bacterium]|nr:cell division protein FtsQ/DivIB [Elusimicrobiota bacterium]